MQSYVITFYRGAGEGRPENVVGTFLDPAGGAERAFTGLAELRALIEEAGAAWIAIVPPERAFCANPISDKSD